MCVRITISVSYQLSEVSLAGKLRNRQISFLEAKLKLIFIRNVELRLLKLKELRGLNLKATKRKLLPIIDTLRFSLRGICCK